MIPNVYVFIVSLTHFRWAHYAIPLIVLYLLFPGLYLGASDRKTCCETRSLTTVGGEWSLENIVGLPSRIFS